ncbi:hypothetical protein [Streptomyces sp. NPDC058548]
MPDHPRDPLLRQPQAPQRGAAGDGHGHKASRPSTGTSVTVRR